MRVVTVDVEPSWFTGCLTSNNTKHVPSHVYYVKQKMTFIGIYVLVVCSSSSIAVMPEMTGACRKECVTSGLYILLHCFMDHYSSHMLPKIFSYV
jgi:hypothetical protein